MCEKDIQGITHEGLITSLGSLPKEALEPEHYEILGLAAEALIREQDKSEQKEDQD
jgi:hypothetical protein